MARGRKRSPTNGFLPLGGPVQPFRRLGILRGCDFGPSQTTLLESARMDPRAEILATYMDYSRDQFRLTLRCGSEKLKWEHFAAVQSKLCSSATSKTYSAGSQMHLWMGVFQSGPRILSLPSSGPEIHGLPSFFETLRLFHYRFATDPRDIIYALVGLTSARDDPLMLIDYTQSVRQVYIKVVNYVLTRQGRLDVICSWFASKNILDLPSWAPD